MHFNVISKKGDGLGLACHLSSEGHSVQFLCEDIPQAGQGAVDNVSGACDITIFGSDEYGREADQLRSDGKRVLGASRWSKAIEGDAQYKSQIIHAIGWDKTAIDNGINLYITTWFNGTTFISTYVSIVYRRFMTGGRGPDLGCVGFLSDFYAQPVRQISERILKPLEKILRKVNHRGCFHIHTLVKGEDFDVKDISASMNKPISLALFENARESATNILLALLNEGSSKLTTLERWVCGVLVSLPPYPYNVPHGGCTLSGLSEKAIKHFWLCDANKENNVWKSSGSGKLGFVTARGKSVTAEEDKLTGRLHIKGEALRRVFRTLNNLQLRDVQYRDDIGKDINWLLRELRAGQWIK